MTPPQPTAEAHQCPLSQSCPKIHPEGAARSTCVTQRRLREAVGYQPEVRYCDGNAAVPPPAMLVGDVLITPSDGVIVSFTSSFTEDMRE